MIGLGAHLARIWFVCARVDAPAAEWQRPNCCLKEALPAPMPASLPVCSSKHRDAWTLSRPAGSSARPASATSLWKTLTCSWLWQYGYADGTLGWEGRLAWGLQHAMQSQNASETSLKTHGPVPPRPVWPGETDGCNRVSVSKVKREMTWMRRSE